MMEAVSVDSKLVDFSGKKKERNLKTSGSLEFMRDIKESDATDEDFWSLYEKGKKLGCLKFSNGKTQRDVVKEVVELIKSGRKIIFLHGVCGTGKSAIALNIARTLGKTSIVVPIKSLQKQYEEDYVGKKYLIRKDGKRLKIAVITGRDNHESIIAPGESCAYPYLPDTIKLSEKNFSRIKDYYHDNPFITNTDVPDLKRLRRISIAPANPYWSPILPIEIELKQLKDAKKYLYKGMNGRDFVFYHRKEGCSYYDQYFSYISADVIIFNSAKYLSEISFGRKPETEIDIIDEADEFLDSLSNSVELNLTRLGGALRIINYENADAKETAGEVRRLIDAEETRARAIGIDENRVYEIKETHVLGILKFFLGNRELQSEVEIDELNYANVALQAAKNFEGSFSDVYVSYKKDEENNLYVRLVTTNLAKKFKEIVDGNKALVLMSGTLHSDDVLKNIFGITDFSKVEAETLNQGSLEVLRTGKEFDCKYSNFQSKRHSREDYLDVLSEVVEKAEKPVLVHVNAFADLPSDEEKAKLEISNVISREDLRILQKNDKLDERVAEFRRGEKDILFTTKCSRGIDFPGDTCKSVVFTKYPNSNVKDNFWKVLQRTHPNAFWGFYRDKARRSFLQRIYRAVRSKNDRVFVLSPDSRVLDAVRALQKG